MKNKKRIFQIIVNIIAIISVILNLVTIILPMSIDEYFNHEIHNEWLRDSAPDRKYTIVLNEVGHSFLFGASKANITLFNSNDRIAYFDVSIKNDGDPLDDNNCKIDWQDEYVKVTTIDYKGNIEEIYRFYYDDYLKS